MGVWSAGSFGNDAALDFIGTIDDFSSLEKSLSTFAGTTGDLDADTACSALAVCDLLAASMGRPPEDLPEPVSFEVENVSATHLDTARALVDRVRSTSELAELWAEEDDAEWQAELDGLLARLDPSRPYEPPVRKAKAERPDDYIGHCYICSEMVTERDGIDFEVTLEQGGTIGCYPHRACVEERVEEPGPYWNPDGTPTKPTRNQILRDMGMDI